MTEEEYNSYYNNIINNSENSDSDSDSDSDTDEGLDSIQFVNNTDTLATFAYKFNYNMKLLQKYGGGPKGEEGEKGSQGETGERGSSIYFIDISITDPDFDPNSYTIGDLVVEKETGYIYVAKFIDNTIQFELTGFKFTPIGEESDDN